MKAFRVLILLLATSPVLNAQEGPFKSPKAKVAAAPVTEWSRVKALLRAAYGRDLAEDLMEQVVSNFVSAAARQDAKAPVTGIREEKAKYYLRLMRNVHRETYLREEAQKAADARVEELRETLPQE